jgi:hypothetical protein
MKKKDTIKEAVEAVYRLFSPTGCLPTRKELEDILKWVYDKGKRSKKWQKSI